MSLTPEQIQANVTEAAKTLIEKADGDHKKAIKMCEALKGASDNPERWQTMIEEIEKQSKLLQG